MACLTFVRGGLVILASGYRHSELRCGEDHRFSLLNELGRSCKVRQGFRLQGAILSAFAARAFSRDRALSLKAINASRAMDSQFRMIFLSAAALTALCGVLMGTIAIFGPNPQPPPISALFETLKYGFTVGMLSIFGMLSTLPPRQTPPKKREDLPA